MAVLIINRNESRCGTCNGPVDPRQKYCKTYIGYEATRDKRGCGAVWTEVTTHYTGEHTEAVTRNMRPDLEFVRAFPHIKR